MKRITLAMVFLLSIAGSFSVLAQQDTAQPTAAETLAADTETAATANPQPPCPMQGTGMKHKHHGRHGKGHGGMKHDCKHHHKDKHERHQRVVQRLDMIEARLAKIEAMLESLMRR